MRTRTKICDAGIIVENLFVVRRRDAKNAKCAGSIAVESMAAANSPGDEKQAIPGNAVWHWIAMEVG